MSTTDIIALDSAGRNGSRSTADNQPPSRRSFFRETGLRLRPKLHSFASEDFGMRLERNSRVAFDLAGSHATHALEPERGGVNSLEAATNLTLLDLTRDAICIRSLNDVIEYWNRAAEELYGWTKAEAVGRASHALFKTVFPVPLDSIKAELQRTGQWEGELVHTLKNGARVTIASRWTLLRYDAFAPIVIFETGHDITKHKRADAGRVKLEARLRQAERLEAIGRFASGIAHDFNNMLGGVLAYGEMLFDEAPEDSPRRRHAQNVLTAATRGRELVQQILTYSRSRHAKHEPLDMCSTVAETLELLRASVPASVTLKASISEAPIVVMGHATQFHQVLMNLCSNSIQAMSAGGTLRVAIEPMDVPAKRSLSHGTLRQGRWVCLRVEDSGCGMGGATLTRIFEPFYTTKELGRGTGLGLALVCALVTDLSGAIDVESVLGEGSTFSVYIPMADEVNAVGASA